MSIFNNELNKAKSSAILDCYSNTNDITKSNDGEGSRGGHIIGHTRSGKAIYNEFVHADHKNFDSVDHYDAHKLHNEIENTHKQLANEYRNKERGKDLQITNYHIIQKIKHLKAFIKAGDPKEIKIFREHLDKAFKPIVDRNIDFHKEKAKKDNKPFTEKDEEYIRNILTYDALSSIETYILPNDKFVDIYSKSGVDGRITIDLTFKREGIQHNVTTQIIYAGGYNIQTLHTRYISDSTSPRNNEKFFTLPIERKLDIAKNGEKRAAKINKEVDKITREKDRMVKMYDKSFPKGEVGTKEEELVRYNKNHRIKWESLEGYAKESWNGRKDDFEARQDSMFEKHWINHESYFVNGPKYIQEKQDQIDELKDQLD